MRRRTKKYPRPLKILFPDYFKNDETILATHRGYGKHGPIAENSLEAFLESTRLGFKAHELDVRITLDLKTVLLHGPRLEQTTSGVGRVEKKTWAYLKNLDWGNYINNKKRTVKPLQLPEYLKEFRNKVFTNIEIKHDWFVFNHKLENEIMKVCTESRFKGNYLYSSFNLWSLRYLRKVFPEAAIGILIGGGPFTLLKIAFGRMFVKPDTIHLPSYLATKKRIQKYKNSGYGILVWGINTQEQYEQMKSYGVNIIVTDNMELCNQTGE